MGFLIILVVLALGSVAGWLLVKENPKKSDVIVVLDGRAVDFRFAKGLAMLRNGYGNVLFLDASIDHLEYGHTPAEYAERYIHEIAPDVVDRIKICPTQENSTAAETKYVSACMASIGATSGLIVTSDFHTRRALSVFTKKAPQYHWTVAAALNSGEYGSPWWKRREWAKTCVWEWERTLWWHLVDRWRK